MCLEHATWKTSPLLCPNNNLSLTFPKRFNTYNCWMSKLIFEPATFLRFLNVILLLTFDLPFDLSLSNLIIDIKVKQ